MEFFTTNDKENTLNYISDTENLRKVLVNPDEMFKYLKDMQKFTDDHGQFNRAGQKVFGGKGDLKLVARIPHALLIQILIIEPEFLSNKQIRERWLDANPAFRAYSKKGMK